MRYFLTRFLEPANDFMAELDSKSFKKVMYNIDMAEQTNNPRLFKKLRDDIWEFRVAYYGNQIRLLAFWDKSDKQDTIVISTHGIIKKTDKTPKVEMERAESLRIKYFNEKK